MKKVVVQKANPWRGKDGQFLTPHHGIAENAQEPTSHEEAAKYHKAMAEKYEAMNDHASAAAHRVAEDEHRTAANHMKHGSMGGMPHSEKAKAASLKARKTDKTMMEAQAPNAGMGDFHT